MQIWQIATILAVALVVAGAVWMLFDYRTTSRLRRRFGPEYEHIVEETGDRRRAETEMAKREARLRELAIRPLNLADRERYQLDWKLIQSHFVDNPGRAVEEADQLVTNMMRMRGYSSDPDARFDDITAAYPRVAESFRQANGVVRSYTHGEASTEDLRQAFVHYRELFGELLGSEEELKRVS